MRPKSSPNYLAGYPDELSDQVRQFIEQGLIAEKLLQRYSTAHTVRTDRALYDFVLEIKDRHLRNKGVLSRVAFDSKLHTMKNALGMHTRASKAHGGQFKTRREIVVASVFRDMPPEFLRMIVVHELAHLKEMEHNKAFYQLCLHMEPEYHQFEFDLRAYLTYLAANGTPLWPAA